MMSDNGWQEPATSMHRLPDIRCQGQSCSVSLIRELPTQRAIRLLWLPTGIPASLVRPYLHPVELSYPPESPSLPGAALLFSPAHQLPFAESPKHPYRFGIFSVSSRDC